MKAATRQVSRSAFDGELASARDALEAARRRLATSKTADMAASVRASAKAIAAVALRVCFVADAAPDQQIELSCGRRTGAKWKLNKLIMRVLCSARLECWGGPI